MDPPTSFLPPPRGLFISSGPSRAKLKDSLARLKFIYSPLVRGSRRKSTKQLGSGHDALITLRSDAFERGYALKWLTRLVEPLSTRYEIDDTSNHQEDADLLAEASSLLALCAGTSAAGALQRTFSFPCPLLSSPSITTTNSFSLDVEKREKMVTVTLTDIPMDSRYDIDSVGAQTWGGACVLAELIAEDPKKFLPSLTSLSGLNGAHMESKLRILELGAGTGLVSVTLARVLSLLSSPPLNIDPAKKVEILATDFYGPVLANLRKNIASNDVQDVISTRFLDWSVFMSDPTSHSDISQPSYLPHELSNMAPYLHLFPPSSPPSCAIASLDSFLSYSSPPYSSAHLSPQGDDHLRKACEESDLNSNAAESIIEKEGCSLSAWKGEIFEVILGADLVYEPSHAPWLRACVRALLKRPSYSSRHLMKPNLYYAPESPSNSNADAKVMPDFAAEGQDGEEEKQVDNGGGIFHLVIPHRKTHVFESQSVREYFPLVRPLLIDAPTHKNAVSATSLNPHLTTLPASVTEVVESERPKQEAEALVTAKSVVELELGVIDAKEIVCGGEEDDDDEVTYGVYMIGWGIRI